jgi:hypothetical protein
VNLQADDYEEMTAHLCAVAASSGARVVSVLEVGLSKLNPVVTHSLKRLVSTLAQVKNRFLKPLLPNFNLYRCIEGGYGYLGGAAGLDGAAGLVREGLAACVVGHVRALAGLVPPPPPPGATPH